jgi:hypothetical protein
VVGFCVLVVVVVAAAAAAGAAAAAAGAAAAGERDENAPRARVDGVEQELLQSDPQRRQAMGGGDALRVAAGELADGGGRHFLRGISVFFFPRRLFFSLCGRRRAASAVFVVFEVEGSRGRFSQVLRVVMTMLDFRRLLVWFVLPALLPLIAASYEERGRSTAAPQKARSRSRRRRQTSRTLFTECACSES